MGTISVGKTTELPSPVPGSYLEDPHCQAVTEISTAIHSSGVQKFTYARIDFWADELNQIVYELEHLPEASFRKLIEVILVLGEARNELRLARFLFDVEEVQPLYRLVMRNRAAVRGENLLNKALRVWVTS